MAPARESPRLPTRVLLLVALAWAGAVTWGFRVALRYQVAAGGAAHTSGEWPEDAPVARDERRWTLVLCAHPRCPCTRATLGELDRLVARCGERLAVRVLFYSDPAFAPGWERSDLWDHASRIPRAEVVADPLGRFAGRFGASTSGQVFLFAPGGHLAFEGGITAARGHEGANPGAAAIVELVHGGEPSLAHTPVFGCALREESGP